MFRRSSGVAERVPGSTQVRAAPADVVALETALAATPGAPDVLPPSGPEPNLLHISWIGRLFRSRWYPGAFQLVGLVVFAAVMLATLFGPTLVADNIGSTIVWILWWPLLPLSYFVFSRFWCTVCPYPVVGEWFQRLTGVSLKVPRWLRRYGIWIIDLTFLFITWADHVFGIVESPRGTGYLLLAMLGGAIVMSLFFERRAFCSHLCFLGGLSGNYSMTSPLAFRANQDNCKKAGCKDLWCANGSERAAACPLYEVPRTMDSNRDCNMCGNCVKSCPHGSLRLEVRKPTSEFWNIRKPRLDVAFLAIVLVGVVIVQNVTMLGIYPTILGHVAALTGTDNTTVNFTVVFLVAMAAPIALLGAASFASSRLSGGDMLRDFTIFGYALIPLDLAAHMAHNLFHLLGEGLAVPRSFVLWLGGSWKGSTAILNTMTIEVLQYLMLGAGIAATVYAAYRIAGSAHGTSKWRALIPQLLLVALLVAINVYMFTQPMAHRA
jgi:polyferredoxin